MVRLNDQEQIHLQRLVRDSGLPQEKLLRQIILGYQVKAAPPIEYHALNQNLMLIGKNINQIATVANSLYKIDESSYKKNYQALLQFIIKLQKAIE